MTKKAKGITNRPSGPQSGETPQLPIRPPRGEKGETPIVTNRPPKKK
jgi:hypothetical protein